MINIDPNDFANLVKTNAPGSRPIQPLGDREVFFNDIESLPGGPMPHDNKTYMRCKRLGKKQDVKPVTAPDVKSEKAKASKLSGIAKFVTDTYAKNEAMQVMDGIILAASLGLAVYAAWQTKNAEFLVTPAIYAEYLGSLVSYYVMYVWNFVYGYIINPSTVGIDAAGEIATQQTKSLGKNLAKTLLA
jgi:hypothetical protein